MANKKIALLGLLTILPMSCSLNQKTELDWLKEKMRDNYLRYIIGYDAENDRVLSVSYNQLSGDELEGYYEDWHFITARCDVMWLRYSSYVFETSILCVYSHSKDHNEWNIIAKTIYEQ